MIRREDMSSEMWEAMCTPMHVILPASPKTSFGALYVGSWFASVDADLLQTNAIKHLVEVLDSPWGNGQQQSPPGGCDLYKIAIPDSSTADLKSHLDESCKHIHDVLRKGRNVLVYCQQVGVRDVIAQCADICPLAQGISRSSSVTIAYLIKWHGMNYDSALKFVKDRRLCAKPNPGFEKTLREWESETRKGQHFLK